MHNRASAGIHRCLTLGVSRTQTPTHRAHATGVQRGTQQACRPIAAAGRQISTLDKWRIYCDAAVKHAGSSAAGSTAVAPPPPAITLTDKALDHLKKLRSESGSDRMLLRIGVKSGGCSGKGTGAWCPILQCGGLGWMASYRQDVCRTHTCLKLDSAPAIALQACLT